MTRLAAIVLFVLFFNVFLFHPWGSTAVVMQRIGFLTLLLALFHHTVFQPVSRSRSRMYIAVLGATCVGLITRASPFPTVLLHALSLAALLFFVYEYAVTTHTIRSLLEVCLIPLRTGFEYLNGGVRLLGTVFAAREKQAAASSAFSPYRRIVQSLLVGVILGLPAVFVLTALFSNADPVFAKFMEQSTRWLQNLLNADTWERFLTRTIFSVVLFGILSPLLYFVRKPREASVPSFARYRWTTELTVALSMIAVTVGMFLAVQWPYVFVNVPLETDLSRFGVATYSEYVMRGFFELVVASFFLYGVLWVVHILTREQPMQHRRFLRFTQAVVLILFAILIVSVFRRVYLYQMHHGWSLARIYGSFGLLWISILTMTFAGRLIRQQRWVTIEMTATAAIFLCAGLWNAEAFIVRTHPPTVNKRIDYVYLSRMSPDGKDGWAHAYSYAQRVLLSETLTQQHLLDRDDRRNIAYAGSIVNNLTEEYDRLISIYGSPEERTAYYHAMLLPLAGRPNGEYASEAAKLLSLSENGSIDEKTLYNRLNHYRYWQSVVFHPQSKGNYHFYGLMYPEQIHLKTYPNRLEHMFLWNYADTQAYQMLKKEIQPEELARLQQAFYTLYDKIVSQSESEWDYEHDLSFRSPFLE